MNLKAYAAAVFTLATVVAVAQRARDDRQAARESHERIELARLRCGDGGAP